MNEPVEILTLIASEEGTYVIDDIEFLDINDSVVTPNADTVTWCLCDKNKNIINSREDQALVSAASMTVTLSGDDLAISGTEDKIFIRSGFMIKQYERHLAVRGGVNSTLGNDLPVTKEFIFNIENIVCI